MSNAAFPDLPGLMWDVKRTPKFKTLIQAPANENAGTIRIPLITDPLWSFTLQFEFLRDDDKHDEFNELEGFFLARHGGADSFLLDLGALTGKETDSAVENEILVVDVNGNAPLTRTRGKSLYREVVYDLAHDDQGAVCAPIVKKNGVALVAGTDYTLVPPDQTIAGTLNANGISYSGYVVSGLTGLVSSDVITADFGFRYRVRFEQDEQEFNLFLQQLYEAQEVKLVSERARD